MRWPGIVPSLARVRPFARQQFAWPSGDATAEDWPHPRSEAARARTAATADYLLGVPLLGDYLEEGLSLLGYSCHAGVPRL